LRRALVLLCEQNDTVLGNMAILLDRILVNHHLEHYPHTAEHCFARFDRLLKQCDNKIVNVIDMNMLWQDLYFYAGEAITRTDEGLLDLKIRAQYIAKQMADMTIVKDSDDTVKKAHLLPLYLSLTDGLLWLNNERARQRVTKLFDALEPKMLNITVPVQKLWAQCASLSINVMP
jgi:hypothetical protein